MALLVSAGLIIAGAWSASFPKNLDKIGVWGGPSTDFVGKSEPINGVGAVLVSKPSISFPDSMSGQGESIKPDGDVLAAAMVRPDNLGFSTKKANLLIYIVRKGDTLSGIASRFGVSQKEIADLNDDVSSKSLRVGQELAIQPEVKVEAVSVRLASAEAKEEAPSPQVVAMKSLPSISGYFVRPSAGFNWGKLHNNNAIDIANACGTPIVASAEGLVSQVAAEGWNGGYGSYVLIEHPNGTKTKYAHMQTVSVSVGDYVEQSAKLGTMGETGEATGCHIHFEVLGAKNPFVK